MRSQAENAAMHAAAEGRSTLGIPKSVGKKFIAHSHGQDVSALPHYVGRRKAKRLRHEPTTHGR